MKALNYVKQNYWLIGILALAAFLRMYHADFQSIWIDEMYTMIESDPKLSFREFDDIMMFREGMGHLYFLMLKYLYAVFGYSTLTARLFSAFIGILSVYAIYLFGKLVYSKNAGIIAALLLCVNVFHISYSQEARPYVLLMLFTIVSFYRLVLFIRQASLKNALLYGLFTGLIVNAHFVGLITVLSQFLLILFVLIKTDKEHQLQFFKYSFIAGITALLVMLPTYNLFMKMTEYRSGWLTLPGPEGFTTIFHLFLGNTELLYFIFNLIMVFYFINLFREKETEFKWGNIKNNRLIFSGLLLFTWLFLSILLPIIKSYLSEPMILHRYFIGILPALLIILAIGIDLIRNKISKILLLATITLFSLVDIFVVKDYYNTVSKPQFREITAMILKRNKDNEKVVSAYGWLLRYFLNQDESNNPTLETKLEDYVAGMRNGTIEKESFWYLDGNSRPYSLSPQDEQFLNENFILRHDIEKYDTWTRHYISKTQSKSDGLSIKLSDFTPLILDGNGNLMFFENSTIKSKILNLKKGSYKLTIKANSLPETPIQGQNAHFLIKLNGETIADYQLSEKIEEKEKEFSFECIKDRKARIYIIFDNDSSVNGLDRNAIFYAIKLEKK